MDKASLRKQMKQLKSELSEQQKLDAEINALNLLGKCLVFQNAKNVLVYNSLPDEIRTNLLLETWGERKNLFLPRVNGGDLDILAYSKDAMQKGAFDIYEPTGESLHDVREMDLIVVPGVAFDLNGNRLGRGKGYYDKLLCKATCPKLGYIYDLQLLDEIPAEGHDVPMNLIVTDKRIISL